MKRFLSAVTLAAILGAGAAFAKDDYCNVPEDEWQPQETLEEKLKAEGWTIKRVKIDAGCYEVYGKTADGKRKESYFDPKSFKLVRSEEED